MGRKFRPRQFHCVAKNAARASDRGFQPHDEQRGRSFEFCRSRRRRLGVVRCRGRGRRKGRRQQFVVDPIAVREVLMIHVGCTRCVTSSTDQMMKTSMYFDLFLLCVNTMTRMINTNAFFDFTDVQVPVQTGTDRRRVELVVGQRYSFGGRVRVFERQGRFVFCTVFHQNSRHTYGLIALYIANILYCYNCLELCWSLLSPPGVFFLQNICFNYGQL